MKNIWMLKSLLFADVKRIHWITRKEKRFLFLCHAVAPLKTALASSERAIFIGVIMMDRCYFWTLIIWIFVSVHLIFFSCNLYVWTMNRIFPWLSPLGILCLVINLGFGTVGLVLYRHIENPLSKIFHNIRLFFNYLTFRGLALDSLNTPWLHRPSPEMSLPWCRRCQVRPGFVSPRLQPFIFSLRRRLCIEYEVSTPMHTKSHCHLTALTHSHFAALQSIRFSPVGTVIVMNAQWKKCIFNIIFFCEYALHFEKNIVDFFGWF